jgi:hypothetical protein
MQCDPTRCAAACSCEWLILQTDRLHFLTTAGPFWINMKFRGTLQRKGIICGCKNEIQLSWDTKFYLKLPIFKHTYFKERNLFWWLTRKTNFWWFTLETNFWWFTLETIFWWFIPKTNIRWFILRTNAAPIMHTGADKTINAIRNHPHYIL